MADELLARVAEHRRYGRVEVGELALLIHRIDDVRRVIDQITVKLLGLRETGADQCIGMLERFALQRVVDRMQQLLGLIGLAHEVVGAAAQRSDRGVDHIVRAHHDHRHRGQLRFQPVHHLQPGHIREPEVEQHQIVVLAAQDDHGFRACRTLVDSTALVLQQQSQAMSQPRLVVHDEDARGRRYQLRWLWDKRCSGRQLHWRVGRQGAASETLGMAFSAPAEYTRRGSSVRKIVPRPGWLRQRIRPPRRSRIELLSARPMPS